MNAIRYINQRFIFDYPKEFNTLPDYTAHNGHEVTVLRPLVEDIEYNRPWDDEVPEWQTDKMYKVRADDGWIGDVWISELIPAKG